MVKSLDDDIAQELISMAGVGVEISAAFAVSELLISSSNARAQSFATSAQYFEKVAALELVTLTKCISELLDSKPKPPKNGGSIDSDLLKLDSRTMQDLYDIDSGRPVVT